SRWRLEETLTGPDQWTLSRMYEAHRPLYKVAVEDGAGTVLYVSSATGEVVNRTTTASRWQGFVSAILHWIYPTVLRQFDEFWRQFIIWLSLIGCVMCVLGMAVGIWRSSPSRKYRMRERGPTWSPYLGQKRWHHWTGLVFGVLTFTWALSGAFSLNPGRWSPPTTPGAALERLFTGGGLKLEKAVGVRWPAGTREVEFRQYQGEPYYRYVTSAGVKYSRTFEARELVELAARALPGRRVVEQAELREYDWYYYDLKERKKNLPVWRLKFDDPEETWLYVDPKTGSVAAQYVNASRRHRWIYHGLHSLDFPFLYLKRPWWDIMVIVLSIGGIVLSWTGVWIGWQRLRQAARQKRASARMESRPMVPVAGD
ncbi:MAG: PepSY domain-containing protein, partial [Bryobacteraceae bacterium]|nr:PepSY domain-containing protein [Bryobacteraceae bacterium]